MAVVTKVKCNRDISKTKKLIATDCLFFQSESTKEEKNNWIRRIEKKDCLAEYLNETKICLLNCLGYLNFSLAF